MDWLLDDSTIYLIENNENDVYPLDLEPCDAVDWRTVDSGLQRPRLFFPKPYVSYVSQCTVLHQAVAGV